jgi:hypothetical protein
MRLAPDDAMDDDWIDKLLAADPLMIDIDDDDDDDYEPVGPPPTENELDAAKHLLIRWQSSEDFSNTAFGMGKRCLSGDYFNQPQLNFLREAYVLAKFAELRGAESVRLGADQWPDGFIKLQGNIHNIEVTSTHGGRKLGQEYRHVKGPTLDPVENWVKRADSIPKYLDEAISGKSQKNYASPCWLVVYLNISEWGIRQIETEQVIAATKARYAARFADISVLWKGKLY